jgi:hypothetical protein
MIEQESGILEGLKGSFRDKPLPVEATKKGSANYYTV